MTLSSRTRKKVQFYAATVLFGALVGGCTIPNVETIDTVGTPTASGHYIQMIMGKKCLGETPLCTDTTHYVVVTRETARDASNAYGVGGPHRYSSLEDAQAQLAVVSGEESLPTAPQEPTVVEETEEALDEAVAAAEADTTEAEVLDQANEAAEDDFCTTNPSAPECY